MVISEIETQTQRTDVWTWGCAEEEGGMNGKVRTDNIHYHVPNG